MSGRRQAMVISVAVLGVVLSSCGSADREDGAPGTLAQATTSASRSDGPGRLPGQIDTDDGADRTRAPDGGGSTGTRQNGNGSSGGQGGTGGQAPRPEPGSGNQAPQSDPGNQAPRPDPGSGNQAPRPDPGSGNQAPQPDPGTGGQAPQPEPGSGNQAPEGNSGTGGQAPQPDPGSERPGSEPSGGSASAPRPGGAPPDADIIDRLGAFFSFDDFKEAQLAECGEYPNCVKVEIDERSGPGADGTWCAVETTPPPAEDGLNDFIQSQPPGEAVILVLVVDPGVDEQGAPKECDGSQDPGA